MFLYRTESPIKRQNTIWTDYKLVIPRNDDRSPPSRLLSRESLLDSSFLCKFFNNTNDDVGMLTDLRKLRDFGLFPEQLDVVDKCPTVANSGLCLNMLDDRVPGKMFLKFVVCGGNNFSFI